MSLASGLRRGWTLRCGLIAGLVLLVATVPASQVHATTPNLSGFWVNKADTRSGYTLRESKDESVLNASWAGLPPGHTTLRGHFSGTLNTSGQEYDGTFTVTEGTVSGSGTGTFALRSSFFASYPTIDVTLTPDNGGPTSTFTLEIFAALPLVAPEGVTDVITNPSDKPAEGWVDFGLPTMASQLSVRRPATARAWAAATNAILGKTVFSIAPHKSKKVTVLLNKRGRALLKKRGKLKMLVVTHMKNSSGLPTVTKSGIVTIKK